jgi:hypothetical protein
MSPRLDYNEGYDSEDEEIPRYVHHSRGKSHRSVRTSGRSRTLDYDGDDEASDHAAPSGIDRDARACPTSRRYTDDCLETHKFRGARSSRSRGRTDDNKVLYYTKYRNPAKDLPIERDPEGINLFKVRQHTRPSDAHVPSGYREPYEVKVDEYEDDHPRTCTSRRDSRQPKVYKVRVDEYEDNLPARSHTDFRESPRSERCSSRYTEDSKPGELPPRSGPCRSSRPSPVDEDVEYEIREPRGHRSSRHSTDVDFQPVEQHPRFGQRGLSRPSRVDEEVDYEIREPRGNRVSHAAHGDSPCQDQSSRHIGIQLWSTRGPRAAGRGRGPDESDDVEP